MSIPNRLLALIAIVLIALSSVGCIFGGGYVRLRGSEEVHDEDCPLVRRARPGGVVEADDDGPPCIICRPDDAREWAEDHH